ncbi:Tautomerase/MIF superfamily protein [Euphorbia peplus]|nr:Tautomerase/MIF superfamily protein [Euphorbia peplus]
MPIAFASSEEPAAFEELISIGGLDPGVNEKLISTIAEIFQTKLYIHSSRFYIKFYDVQVTIYRLFSAFIVLLEKYIKGQNVGAVKN